MKRILLLIIICISNISFSQNSPDDQVVQGYADGFSHNKAYYLAKQYLGRQNCGWIGGTGVIETHLLAGTESLELTTVGYSCGREDGLLLVFQGYRFNDERSKIKPYAIKNLNKAEAEEFLNMVERILKKYEEGLKDNSETRNILFKYKDIKLLAYHDGHIKIRLLWEGFDAECEYKAFEKTKKIFEEEIR